MTAKVIGIGHGQPPPAWRRGRRPAFGSTRAPGGMTMVVSGASMISGPAIGPVSASRARTGVSDRPRRGRNGPAAPGSAARPSPPRRLQRAEIERRGGARPRRAAAARRPRPRRSARSRRSRGRRRGRPAAARSASKASNGIDRAASCPSRRRSIASAKTIGVGRIALRDQRRGGGGAHLRAPRGDLAGVEALEAAAERPDLVVLDGAGQHAHGGEDAGRRRKEHPRDAERARQVAGMHRPRAAEGEEREVARVEAALHGHRADGAHHVGVGHLAHAQRRRLDREAERAASAALDRAPARRRRRAASAPPARRGGRKPSTTLASVTVGALAAQPVADRPRDRRRPTAGRRVSRPAASMAAIEPAPLPTSATSTVGTRIM